MDVGSDCSELVISTQFTSADSVSLADPYRLVRASRKRGLIGWAPRCVHMVPFL